ncbi:superoxide dismutase family protein [Arenimonas soli]|uniref:superoxide dismutase family protein n=1 Tax=Arenimonas soli TaxID=2269504 RepID=UPI001664D691|nr:superoxide dismutase family protein [Arenimonas soli]
MKSMTTVLAAALALGLAGCAGESEPDVPTPAPAAAPDALAPNDDASAAAGGIALAAQARVVLAPVQDSGVTGELTFDPDGDALRLHGEVRGLAPGSVHGFHVHETGDCSAPDATSAGGHFNPDQMQHGDRQTPGPHHAGDMPNLTAGADGVGQVDVRLAGLQIDGEASHDVVGRAVIVHAQADDYATQPTGNAGARIACGVVELVQPAPDYQGPAS